MSIVFFKKSLRGGRECPIPEQPGKICEKVKREDYGIRELNQLPKPRSKSSGNV